MKLSIEGYVVKCCEMCQCYQAEEVGDSDYGAIYSDELSCSEYLDCDKDENPIEGFDRKCERECCCLDFFLVADVDKEIGDAFGEDMMNGDDGNFDRSYEIFKKKYKL